MSKACFPLFWSGGDGLWSGDRLLLAVCFVLGIFLGGGLWTGDRLLSSVGFVCEPIQPDRIKLKINSSGTVFSIFSFLLFEMMRTTNDGDKRISS
jgi:hypothetical protein